MRKKESVIIEQEAKGPIDMSICIECRGYTDYGLCLKYYQRSQGIGGGAAYPLPMSTARRLLDVCGPDAKGWEETGSD